MRTYWQCVVLDKEL